MSLYHSEIKIYKINKYATLNVEENIITCHIYNGSLNTQKQ